MSDRHDWAALVQRVKGNYTLLLFTLLAVFAVSPFVTERGWIRWILVFTTLGMVVSALLACWRRTSAFVIVIFFALASQALSAADQALSMSYADVGSDALRFGFLLLVTGTIFSDVLRAKHVTMNTVFGASCVYLLMSLTWAAFFSALEKLEPGSFAAGGSALSVADTGAHVDAQLIYFSLITLTTIGYGDITPVSPPARILCGLEGLIGQLFIAIIIARLVALEIADRLSPSD